MKRIFIIHGWSGSPHDNWLPWLKNELEKLGFEVITPEMPATDTPTIETWVNYLKDLVGKPDSNTYFIGHSIGCQAILRYLEQVNVSVGGAVFVAGWFNLDNLETKDEKIIAKPWVENPIDLEKVKINLPKSTLIISSNDDYGAFEENREKFSRIVTKEVVLHNAGHITGVEYPEIISEIVSIIDNKN